MRMYDVIYKKRNGGRLSAEEINFFVKGITEGSIADYQISALLMAIFFQGMNEAETLSLTLSMINSGETLDLSEIEGVIVDKHSTGGVGDKTSIALLPLVAAAGIPVAKLSGRGLGHTGGTIDKLESIRGFSVEMNQAEFVSQVNRIGIALGGQTRNLVPADKKIYALRDVTATVENHSLIASSIMSKKLAAGTDAIVLDVKSGNGAYMKTPEEALTLAKILVGIGNGMNKRTVAVISDMNQPLGNKIGNALEVEEAIDTLKGKGPADLHKLCLELGSRMLVFAKPEYSLLQAQQKLEETIASGAAFQKLCEMVKAQGGDISQIEKPELLPKAKYQKEILSPEEGFISEIFAETTGFACMTLGAGRLKKEDHIDHSAGIFLHKKRGDFIQRNEPLATLYTNNNSSLETAANQLKSAFGYSREKPALPKLISHIVEE